MKTLIVLRHAEAASSGHLTSRGILQAEKRASTLLNLPRPDLVIVSSAERTQETARIILGLNIPFLVCKELYLPLEKAASQEVIKILKLHKKEPFKACIENDEAGSFDFYIRQAYFWIKHAIEQNKAENILIVAHAQVINGIGLLFKKDAKELDEIYFSQADGFYMTFKDQEVTFKLLDPL